MTVLDDWDLTPDGDPWHGHLATVLPVTTADGTPAVVKFSAMREEQEHEHIGLRLWSGNGTVRLYRADPSRGAMLLERLDGDRSLLAVDVLEACEITARFYERLHLPATPQLRTLSSYVAGWTTDLAALEHPSLPRSLVEHAVSLGRGFAADPATDGTMIHGDLHYENVLAGEREPWLVIDPKPMSGDPHYEVAPLLWNRWEEVQPSDSRADVRRRFHAVVDTAGLDEDRTRDWVIVRMAHNVMWAIEDAAGALDAEDREWITICVTIAKAVQE